LEVIVVFYSFWDGRNLSSLIKFGQIDICPTKQANHIFALN
jgi:hypothetical protein